MCQPVWIRIGLADLDHKYLITLRLKIKVAKISVKRYKTKIHALERHSESSIPNMMFTEA